MTSAFDLTPTQQETVVSILYLGGFFGALIGGSLCDSFGRKRAILVTDVVFLIGAIILLTAPSVGIVVLGRVVLGWAIAVSGIADVSYLHEIAPVHYRGAIVSVNEACISLGFLLAFVVGSLLAKTEGGWRIMFGCSGILALIQFIGMLNMPESPKWLVEQGRHEEAENELERIQGGSVSVIAQGSDHRSRATRTSITSYEAVAPPAVDEPLATLGLSSPGRHSGGLMGRISFYSCQFVYLMRQLHTFTKETVTTFRRQAYIAIFLAVCQQFCGQVLLCH